MKIVFFDLETTGLSSVNDTMLEIAAIVIDEDLNVVDTFQSFINPGKQIPFIITKLTGISNDTVKYSKSENVVLNEFMNWVKKHDPRFVAGHNIKRFDLKWIIEKCNKYSIRNYLNLEAIDTLEYATRLHKEGVLIDYTALTEKGRVSFKLEHLVRYFGLSEQTHRAIDDVMQNVIVYKRLKALEETKDYGF